MSNPSLDQNGKQKLLQKLYYNPKQGLFNATKLYQKVRELGIKLQEVRDFIKRQKTGQLYKGPTKTLYYPITAPPGSFQADLIFYPKTKKINNGYDTALTLIEITSRMGYLIPMKGKKTAQVIEAMESFLKLPGIEIKNLTTDKGSEFISGTWKRLMQDHNIQHILADEGDHRKMGLVERFNKTAKSLISKYQTMYQTKKWIDAIPDLIENYNNTVHSTIGYAPTKVGIREMALIRFDAAQKTARLDRMKNLNVGDKVRILQRKPQFGKEGAKWSDEVFTITEDNTKSFKLEGQHRKYKHYELQKVEYPPEENPFPREPKTFDVEEHLKKARSVPRAPREERKERPITRAATGRSKPKKLGDEWTI